MALMARSPQGERDPRLVVDWTRCDAHGMCAELLPELLGLDEWGYPVVSGKRVPADLVAAARRARDACPAVALRLANR